MQRLASKIFEINQGISSGKQALRTNSLSFEFGGQKVQEFSLSEGGYKLASFDQFRENKEKYNYQSKYDEKFYTTQLDKNKITATQREETERLVKEIEG